MFLPAVDAFATNPTIAVLAAVEVATLLSALIDAPEVTDSKVPPEIRTSKYAEAEAALTPRVTVPPTCSEPVPAVLPAESEGAVITPVLLVPVLSQPVVEAVDGTADKNPAVNAATATVTTRCLIVFVDIYFLSLVRIRNFLNLARRSFDPLIPFPMAHTCNAARYGNLFIQWVSTHHLFALVLAALESQSQVVRQKVACDRRTQ